MNAMCSMKKTRILKGCLFVSLLLFILTLNTPTTQAISVDQIKGLELVSGIGGHASALAIRGNQALIGVGANLHILDVSNPAAPKELGRLLLPNLISSIALDDKYAYIGGYGPDGGLHIVDFSDPAAPVVTGSWLPKNEQKYSFVRHDGLFDLKVLNGWVYASVSMGDIYIFNAKNPLAPSLEKVYWPNSIKRSRTDLLKISAIKNNYAYCANGDNGLLVLDLTDPASPVVVSSSKLFYAKDLVVSGKYAYSINHNNDGMGSSNILNITDISDPRNPKAVGTCNFPKSEVSIYVRENYVYLNGEMFSSEGPLTEVIHIINVSNPALPKLVVASHRFNFIGITAGEILFTDNGLVYGAGNAPNSFVVCKLTTPTQLKEVGSWKTIDYGQMAINKNHIYRYNWEQLSIIDISTPKNPVVVETRPWGKAAGFIVNGSLGFLWDGDNNLRILDVSDPRAPKQISITKTERLDGATRVDDYLYLLENISGQGRLLVLDISNPVLPKEVGHLMLSAGLLYNGKLLAINNYLYLTCDDGLHIINIQERENPIQVSLLGASRPGSIIAASGECLYWSTDGRLRVVDISKPESAQVVGDCPVGVAETILVAQDYLVVSTSTSDDGLYIVDITQPSKPKLKAVLNTPDSSHINGEIAWSENGEYIISASYEGIYLLKLTETFSSSWKVIFNPLSDIIPNLNLSEAIAKAIGKPLAEIKSEDLTKITSLNLEYENDITDLNGIEHCANLESLTLPPGEINDLSFLSKLTKLRSLNLLKSHVTNLNGIKYCVNLEELTLSGNGSMINNLSELSSLTNLTKLNLSGNQINDAGFLSKLPKLFYLYLDGCNLKDLQFLTSLNQLSYLVLANNQLTDITPVGALKNLSSLHLESNQIQDIQALEGLSELRQLWLNANKIENIDVLLQLPRLKRVDIRENPVDLTPGSPGWKVVEALKAKGYRVNGIQYTKQPESTLPPKVDPPSPAVTAPPAPEPKVDQPPSQVESLPPALAQIFPDAKLAQAVAETLGERLAKFKPEDFAGIFYLKLSNKGIADLSGIEHFANLTNLDLSDNQINDASPVRKLTKLKSLKLGKNNLKDFRFLTSLDQLNDLDLSGNQINDADFVSKLTKLKSLVLGNNQLTDITFLSALKSLESLDLRSNQIKDIKALEGLSNLSAVQLDGNNIANIDVLSGLQKLRFVYIRKNPVDLTPVSPGLKVIEALKARKCYVFY